jgi:hypothetical protein
MKYKLSLLVFVPAIFFACHKNAAHTQAGNGIYITANANGLAETFNTGITASLSSSGGLFNLVIKGTAGTGATPDQMVLVINGAPGPISTGTYTPAGSQPTPVTVLYTNNDGRKQYSNDTANASYQPEITITSINGNLVQGTFSGNLILYSTPSLGVKTENITGGKFSVTVQQ